ncbi:MAG: thiamine pyrophosphate-binding protein [Candidatus Nanopelagicales bacterium]
MNGSQYLVEAVHAQGVDHCFMVPGGLDDAFMGPMTATDGLRTVVAAFEGGAAYLADGYARASGRLGVAFGIGGPGVLNMATALAAARADRTPVLAVSGEVPTSWEGLGGFQDASGAALDDTAALRPLTGLSLNVSAPQLLPHHLRQAVTHALVEREPVHLAVPVDVQKATVDTPWAPVPERLWSPHHLDQDAFDRILDLFGPADPARNVVLLVGPGIQWADAFDDLVRVAERYEIPVATTLAGKGVFPEDHPLALGVFGYGGSRWAIDALLDPSVEVLVVLGTGLSQRDTLQWDPKMLPSRAMVHVDADPLVIGRTWPSELPVVGDCGTALRHLLELDGDLERGLDAGRRTRREFLAAIRSRGPACYAPGDRGSDALPMHPARVVSELRAACPRDTMLSVDSGAHRAWFAEYWDAYGPRTHFSLTNLGPMGGAIPLGIGAKLARPEAPMVIATGDGCMLMHGMELHTAAREGVPVVVALMDNRSYGNIWYRAHPMGPGPEALTDIPGMDWVGFARSVGAEGEVVERPDQIAAALRRGLDAGGPYLLDLRIDKHFTTPVSPWRQAVKEWEDDH